MTNEEAIKEINKVFEPAFANYIITALIEGVTASDKAVEQEPCDDCISRQAVLDIIMPYCQDDDGSVENTGDLRNALDDIEALSPVTPKEKTGHWEYVQYDGNPNIGNLHCSECERIAGFEYNFCPKCGARMVSE